MLACLRVLYQNGSLNYGVVGFILVGVFFFFFGGGGGRGGGGGVSDVVYGWFYGARLRA